MTARPLTVLLVAAEASGDDRGAALARALRRRLGGDIRFVGVGGGKLAAEGLKSPFDIAELSILGLLEGLLALPRVRRRARQVAQLAVRERPDIAVLIDSWGFTLRVALQLRRALPALPLVKYVGPQVWASRPGRARTTARTFDHLLAIHAFDAPYFEKEGLPVTFVGDATLSIDFAGADPDGLRNRLGVAADAPIVLIAPGSRPGEIARVLPAFADAARRIAAARPDAAVLVLAAPTVAEAVRAQAAAWTFPYHILEGEAAKRDAMAGAAVALACSGTVTTELAIAGAPVVVGYRLGSVTHAILKRLIRTPYVTLFNIAAQEFVAPELIQDDCNGSALAAEVLQRLNDPALARAQVERQTAAITLMGRGEGDASAAAADAVLAVLARASEDRARAR